jgi:predicted DNA-binding transcriptional regulator AlpA
MTLIPEIGFLRVSHIVGNLKANPPVLPIIPIGKSSWWAGVRSGIYPQPLKLSPQVTVWRIDDIKALIAEIEDRETS